MTNLHKKSLIRGVAKLVEFNGKTKQNIDVIRPAVIPSILSLVKVMAGPLGGLKMGTKKYRGFSNSTVFGAQKKPY